MLLFPLILDSVIHNDNLACFVGSINLFFFFFFIIKTKKISGEMPSDSSAGCEVWPRPELAVALLWLVALMIDDSCFSLRISPPSEELEFSCVNPIIVSVS